MKYIFATLGLPFLVLGIVSGFVWYCFSAGLEMQNERVRKLFPGGKR